MGLVHTWEHGPRYSVADMEPTVRRWKGKGLIYMPWMEAIIGVSVHIVEHLRAHR